MASLPLLSLPARPRRHIWWCATSRKRGYSTVVPNRKRSAMLLVVSLLVGGFFCFGKRPGLAEENNLKPVRCLVVTGEDYPGHKWKETTPVLKKALEEGQLVEVDVIEDLTLLRTEKPFQYQVLVLHFKNYDPNIPGEKALENLEGFVRDGGGLVLVHFACGAFQEFKDRFVKLAGRVWDPQLRAHDPYGQFTVRITDHKHPITRGLEDFETTDELYTCLAGEVPVRILAVARSRVDGKDYPMAFVLEVGKGRVFHCVLGHDTQALESGRVQELYRRAVLWCAGRRDGADSHPGKTGAE